MAANPINELTDNSMKNLRALVDSNTVIGNPVTTPDGTTILPVSKVSFGFGTGGRPPKRNCSAAAPAAASPSPPSPSWW